MFSVAIRGKKLFQNMYFVSSISHILCNYTTFKNEGDDGFESVDRALKEAWKNQETDFTYEKFNLEESPSDIGEETSFEKNHLGNYSGKRMFFANTKVDAERVIEVLRQDGPGFDTKAALDDLRIRVSGLLVRAVLSEILKTIHYANKTRCAKLGYKFFIWSGQQKDYNHTVQAYHLIMKIFADAEELKAMWRLVDEMTENGFPTTAHTFKIVICTCGEVGLAKKVVERFLMSKSFNFRPFKHSFNAILHSLLKVNQYKLIEWVYEKMLKDGHYPDILTYNILMCAKYRLGKLDQFHKLIDEMGRSGFSPDLHTYNILLHVLGKRDKPLAAVNLLNHMKEVGCEPSILHFTTLVDGLSRVGNISACKYFFDEMIKNGFTPDVVSYTVLITGYIVAEELEKALDLLDEMIDKGQMPNAFTYNSIIRGLCMKGMFEKACLMLKEMECRGCEPNFLVYYTLVNGLRDAGKLSEANEVIREMIEKGRYIHLVTKFKGYRRY